MRAVACDGHKATEHAVGEERDVLGRVGMSITHWEMSKHRGGDQPWASRIHPWVSIVHPWGPWDL